MRKIVLKIPDGVEVDAKGGRFIAWISLQFDARDKDMRDVDCMAIIDKAMVHLDLPSRKE